MARVSPLTSRRAPFAALLGLLLAVAVGCDSRGAGSSLQVWAVSDLHQIDETSPVLNENEIYSQTSAAITLRAALNETIAFQIVAQSAAPPAGPFEVEITPLTGQAGTLPADCIRLYRAAPLRVEDFRAWYPEYAGRSTLPRLVDEILVPWNAPRGGGPLRISDGRPQVVWIDVQVPPTAAPGEYTAALVLRPAGGSALFGSQRGAERFRAELRVQVLPVALPSERSLAAICRVDPRDLLEQHLGWPRIAPEELRLRPGEPSHAAALRVTGDAMRLLQSHRANPVLWASFPKFRPLDERTVEVDWAPYDELVAGWLDGSAFEDGVGLRWWIAPVSLEYPDAARNGGLDAPRYARLLAAYLQACAAHFDERGWTDRLAMRPAAPAPLSAESVARVARFGAIARQAGGRLPLVAHLPAESPRALGWHGAPPIDLPDVNIWAPPADWLEARSLPQRRSTGQLTWLLPTFPPFSPSAAPESRATDAALLPWTAYRYDLDGIWIDDAAAAPKSDAARAAGGGLVHAGAPWGLEHPVPSMRLKRLRRGLQDVELLRLLETAGRRVLARRTSEQLVRRAGLDALAGGLHDLREPGWSTDPYALWLARRVLLQELANTFEATPDGRSAQASQMADWEQLMARAARPTARVAGARLSTDGESWKVRTDVLLDNEGPAAISGRWLLRDGAGDWRLTGSAPLTAAPGAQRAARLQLDTSALPYSADGTVELPIEFESAESGVLAPRSTRLAVTAARRAENPIRIDGALEDWPRGPTNAAGDFRLVRRSSPAAGSTPPDAPALATRAWFAYDAERLLIAVECATPERADREGGVRSDNLFPVDGATPWEQDVIEVLLDPTERGAETPADLLLLRIKPSGAITAWRGCPTDPPICATAAWDAGAQVATRTSGSTRTCEIAIPWSAFGPAAGRSRVWGLNITRLDARRGEYSSWSGARGHAYAPERLGNLVFD